MSRSVWRDLTLISLVLGLHFLRYGIVFPLIPLFASDLGASPALIGVVVGSFSLFSVFLSVPAGGLVDVFGVKRMLVLGVVCNIANGALLLVARGVPSLLVAQVVGGLGFQLHVVTCQSYVSRLSSAADRERGFGYLTFGAALGQTLGPVLGGVAAAQFGYRAAFLACLLVSAAGLISLGFRDAPRRRSGSSYSLLANFGAARKLLTDSRMRAVLVFSSIAVLTVSLRMSFLPVLLRGRGMTETMVGLLISIFAAASTAVRPFVGFFLAGLTRKVLLSVAAVTIVVGVSLAPVLTSAGALAVALGVFGIGFGLTQPLSMVMVADLTDPERAGVAMGLRFSALTLANLVGPVSLGLVVEAAGLSAAFYLPAMLMGLVGTYLLVLRPQLLPGRREEAVSDP